MDDKATEDLVETFVEGFHSESIVKRMPYRKLKDGVNVSALSLGASAFGEVFNECTQEHVNQVVQEAVLGGINLIDTAHWYGHGKSEERLGKALSGIPRKAYYLHTKCCRYESDILKMFDFSAERTLRAIDESIARLGVEYLDCMQIHDPEYAPSIDIILEQTLPALQKAKDQGKIKRIGITGYPLSIHKDILERSKIKIDTTLVYCHYSLNDTSLIDDGYLDYFASKDIGVINASPVSMGLLTERGPPGWHPAKPEQKEKALKAADYCKSKGVNISKLAMDFTLMETRIPTTLVSTTKLHRIKANLESSYNIGSLSATEKQVLDQVRKDYFSKNESWEGIEVAQYKELCEKAKNGEQVGTLSTN